LKTKKECREGLKKAEYFLGSQGRPGLDNREVLTHGSELDGQTRREKNNGKRAITAEKSHHYAPESHRQAGIKLKREQQTGGIVTRNN